MVGSVRGWSASCGQALCCSASAARPQWLYPYYQSPPGLAVATILTVTLVKIPKASNNRALITLVLYPFACPVQHGFLLAGEDSHSAAPVQQGPSGSPGTAYPPPCQSRRS